jgi:hypothetical protein
MKMTVRILEILYFILMQKLAMTFVGVIDGFVKKFIVISETYGELASKYNNLVLPLE